jgi:hypothetical protein
MTHHSSTHHFFISSLPYEEVVKLGVDRNYVGLDPHHPAAGRPHPEPFHQTVDGLVLALSEHLDGSFRGIPHPAMKIQPARGRSRCLAISDPLHPSPDDCPDRSHN